VIIREKSQSILEYVVVLAAIIAAVIVAGNSIIKPKVTSMMQNAGDLIGEKSAMIKTLGGTNQSK